MRARRTSLALALGLAIGSLGLLHCQVNAVSDGLRQIGDSLADAGIAVDVRFDMSLERFDTTTGTFEVLPPPPTPRNLFNVEQAKEKLIVVGGIDGDGDYVSAVDVFDPVSKTWKAGAPWPNVRNAYFVSVDGLLCAIGGTKGTELAPKKDVECYDVDADAWTTKAPIPEDVGEISPAVHGGKVYLLGGGILSTSEIVTPHTKALAFDPKADTWTPLAPLPQTRALAAVVPTGDRLYVVGGIGSAQKRDNGPATRDMLVYDPGASSWASAPQMPNARVLGFGVDAIGAPGELATYFGLSAPLLDRFSAGTNAWRNGTDPAEKIDPGAYTRVVYGGDLYLLVLLDKIGASGTSASGKLWRYSAADDAWSVVGQRSPNERDALFFGVPIGTSLYFAGAFTTAAITQK